MTTTHPKLQRLDELARKLIEEAEETRRYAKLNRDLRDECAAEARTLLECSRRIRSILDATEATQIIDLGEAFKRSVTL